MMYYELNEYDKAIYHSRNAVDINPEHSAPKDLIKLIENKSNLP